MSGSRERQPKTPTRVRKSQRQSHLELRMILHDKLMFADFQKFLAANEIYHELRLFKIMVKFQNTKFYSSNEMKVAAQEILESLRSDGLSLVSLNDTYLTKLETSIENTAEISSQVFSTIIVELEHVLTGWFFPFLGQSKSTKLDASKGTTNISAGSGSSISSTTTTVLPTVTSPLSNSGNIPFQLPPLPLLPPTIHTATTSTPRKLTPPDASTSAAIPPSNLKNPRATEKHQHQDSTERSSGSIGSEKSPPKDKKKDRDKEKQKDV